MASGRMGEMKWNPPPSGLPWWDEDVASIRDLKEYTQKYRTFAEVEAVYLSTGHISGWGYGMLLVDTVRRPVEEVGAANVDGPTLRKALYETDLAVDGFGNRLRLTEEVKHFSQVARVLEYRAAPLGQMRLVGV